jgi:hypothetical protein
MSNSIMYQGAESRAGLKMNPTPIGIPRGKKNSIQKAEMKYNGHQKAKSWWKGNGV